ncbi:MAG: hypothetical protein J3R72DRAFT_241618 [Linnemannia gamsii]|nr:MAG: hypothetical protein J3R72DRAFT_241618 [Linnemannia gamsii]
MNSAAAAEAAAARIPESPPSPSGSTPQSPPTPTVPLSLAAFLAISLYSPNITGRGPSQEKIAERRTRRIKNTDDNYACIPQPLTQVYPLNLSRCLVPHGALSLSTTAERSTSADSRRSLLSTPNKPASAEPSTPAEKATIRPVAVTTATPRQPNTTPGSTIQQAAPEIVEIIDDDNTAEEAIDQIVHVMAAGPSISAKLTVKNRIQYSARSIILPFS